MMANRITSILPKLTFEEALETTKIHSLSGNIKEEGIVKSRPFITPHSSISLTGLIGGGRVPKPGSISLAHNGVLFLDELPEFSKKVLDSLRIPLEDKRVNIDRVNGSFTYPCNFIFLASMNPCPCGYFGSGGNKCKCTESKIKNYRARVSGPLLDRIDIQIDVPKVEFEKISGKEVESSEDIRKRVDFARKIQQERYKKYGIYSNSELTNKLIYKFCILDKETTELLGKYFDKLNLSARAYTRILKVSRTIADLKNKENIEKEHVLEAIRLCRMDERREK